MLQYSLPYLYPSLYLLTAVLLLGGGVCVGWLLHYLHSHCSRSRFEADERRKCFREKIPIPAHIEVSE